MSDDMYTDSHFMRTVATEVRSILIKSHELDDWCASTTALLSENEPTFPDETFDMLASLIPDDEELYSSLWAIARNENAPEKEIEFYQMVFCAHDMSGSDAEPDGDEDEITVSPVEFFMEEENVPEDNDDVQRMKSMLMVSLDTAWVILDHFHWNFDKAVDSYMDNSASVLEAVGIPQDWGDRPLRLSTHVGELECEICYDDDLVNGLALPCGHVYCEGCWKGHMITGTEENAKVITCMADGCQARVMIDDIRMLCGDEVADKRKAYLEESKVIWDNSCMKCTKCDNVLRMDSVGLCSVLLCQCGERICSRCKNAAHAPCTCEQVNEWKGFSEAQLSTALEQARWQRREELLATYRASHVHEIHEVNSAIQNKIREQNMAIDAKELAEREKAHKQFADEPDRKMRVLYKRLVEKLERKHKIDKQDRDKDLNSIVKGHSEMEMSVSSGRYSAFHKREGAEREALRIFERGQHTAEELVERLTKQCPKCQVRIAKADGCNYMKCSRCHFEFCWVCCADWKTHGDHFVCNKFDGKTTDVDDALAGLAVKDEDIDLTDPRYYPPPMSIEVRQRFARFNHYQTRYQGHLDGAKVDRQQKGNFDFDIIRVFKVDSCKAEQELQRVYNAVEAARSVLTWSYPCSYFLPEGSHELAVFQTEQGYVEIFMERVLAVLQRYNFERLPEVQRFTGKLHEHTDFLLRLVDPYTV